MSLNDIQVRTHRQINARTVRISASSAWPSACCRPSPSWHGSISQGREEKTHLGELSSIKHKEGSRRQVRRKGFNEIPLECCENAIFLSFLFFFLVLQCRKPRIISKAGRQHRGLDFCNHTHTHTHTLSLSHTQEVAASTYAMATKEPITLAFLK